MSKRQIETEEGELGNLEDVWTNIIFPSLHHECILFWLRLCLVSKLWYRMVSGVARLRFTLYYDTKRVKQSMVLVERFGKETKELEIFNAFLPYLEHFPKLKSLRVICGEIVYGYKIGNFINLTSLTLCESVYISGIERLVNLTYLSIMHIDNSCCKALLGVATLENIKKLHLGRSTRPFIQNVLLENHYPSKSKIDYLESDSIKLFEDVNYTGLGKWSDRHTIVLAERNISYEGEWLNGKRHGNGTYSYNYVTCHGIWKNGFIINGSIECLGFEYKGGLKEMGHKVVPHGNGVKKYDTLVCEGLFIDGRIQAI